MSSNERPQRPPKKYVYRSKRTGQKVHRTYLGPLADPVVRALDDADALDSATRAAATRAADEALEDYARLEPVVRFVVTNTNRLIRQDRERQRRERLRCQEGQDMSDVHPHHTARATVSRDEFDEFAEQATAGDVAALKKLRDVLRRNPAVTALLGDVAGHVEQHLVGVLGAESAALRESVRLHMDETRRQLLAEGDSPLERLLVNQVIMTMLDAAIRQVDAERGGIGATRRRRFERAMDRAQRRHLRAVTALHELRARH